MWLRLRQPAVIAWFCRVDIAVSSTAHDPGRPLKPPTTQVRRHPALMRRRLHGPLNLNLHFGDVQSSRRTRGADYRPIVEVAGRARQSEPTINSHIRFAPKRGLWHGESLSSAVFPPRLP